MDLGLVLIHDRTRTQNQQQITGLLSRITPVTSPLGPQHHTINGIAALHTAQVFQMITNTNTTPNNLGSIFSRVIYLPAGATDGRVFNVACKRAIDAGMEGVLFVTTVANFNGAAVIASYQKMQDQNLGYLSAEPYGRAMSARFLRAVRRFLNDGGTFAEVIEVYKVRAADDGVSNG